MKYPLMTGLLVLFISFGLHAADPVESFNAANKIYRSGRYEEAARSFEDLLRGGNRAPEVYFNLGNCYFKLQQYPKAILNYERARRLDPLDEDIAYNLKMAVAGTVDKIEPVPLLFYQRWWESFLRLLGPSGWSLLAVAAAWLAMAGGVWFLTAQTVSNKKRAFFMGSSLVIVMLLSFFIARAANSRLSGKKDAIIMEVSTYVKSSPDDKSTNLFMLHAGTKVEVIDELGGWKQIRIANGNSGWIADSMVESI